MKIALLTDGITPFIIGGMQRHSANLAKYFTLAGLEVTLIHCVSQDQNLPSEKEVNESLFGKNSLVQLHNIVSLKFPKPGKIPGHYIRNSYNYSKQVFESLDWSAFDFVYAKGFCGWYYMEQKNKGMNLPPIGVKFHGYEMFQQNNSLIQKLKVQLLRKATVWNNQHADIVFSYGGRITELIKQKINVPISNIIELTSGIDRNWIRDNENISSISEVTKFVFVGRDEKRKGIEELNEAIKIILNKNSTNFEFHFIGPIPTSKQIHHKSIFYYGELNDKFQIIQILDQMDVLVCPSHSEGMPNVILEGMARGLAIIATNVGAVNQMVDNSVGRLIQPFKTNELIAAINEMMLLGTEEIIRLKKASIQRTQFQFEWSVLIQDLITRIKEKTK